MLKAVIAISLLSVSGCLCILILTLEHTVAAIPDQIADTRRALEDQVQALRVDAFAEIHSQVSGIRHDSTVQLDAIRGDLRQAVQSALESINGMRSDLKPLLANAAALTKDLQDSIDDSYPDTKALLESTTVATTQVAQTMETVRQASPQTIATAQETNKQIAGIATDLHTVTSKFVKPQSLKAKIWDAFRSLALIASHF